MSEPMRLRRRPSEAEFRLLRELVAKGLTVTQIAKQLSWRPARVSNWLKVLT